MTAARNPPAWVAMRKAAALAFAVPGLEIDVRSGDRVITRVRRRPGGGQASVASAAPDREPATVMCPAAFRGAVGTALATAVAPLPFLDPTGAEAAHPELFMPFTGAVRSFGMVVARLGEVVVHVVATTRSPSEALAVVNRIGCHPSSAVSVDASFDPTTQVTLLHAQSRVCDLTVARPHIEAMMDTALVQLGVAEIMAAVSATTTEPTSSNPAHSPAPEPAPHPATRPTAENRQDRP